MENYEERKTEARQKLIEFGVNTLKKLRYRRVNNKNIFSNKEYAIMFGAILIQLREQLTILRLMEIMAIDEIVGEIVELHNLNENEQTS